MSNILDATDSVLVAQAMIQDWQDEFLAQWYAPIIKMINTAALESIRQDPRIDKNKMEKNLSPQGRARLRGE
jgi:hypothetical protein